MQSDVVDGGEALEEPDVAEAREEERSARKDRDEERVRVVKSEERERRSLPSRTRHSRRKATNRKCIFRFSLDATCSGAENRMVSLSHFASGGRTDARTQSAVKQSVKEARSLEFVEIAGTSYAHAVSPRFVSPLTRLTVAVPPKPLGF